jgi:L-threonylcarbamoyladenylate synthase
MTQVSLDGLIRAALTGDLVAFPTDTVPALATLPQCAELIFHAKQRSQNKPLILMAGRVEDLWQFTRGTQSELAIWQGVADRYLPGALTLVLPASDRVPAVMNPNGDLTIGLRVPAHPIARSILLQVGAMATTSANLSGDPPLLTMAEISTRFPQVLTLDLQISLLGQNIHYDNDNVSSTIPSQDDSMIEVNTKTQNQPSTVVKWGETGWQLLRQGAIAIDEI